MGIKRSLYFLTATLALLFFTFAAQGEGRPFITRWKGEAGKELKIPIFGENYKLVIKKASDNSVLKTESALTVTEEDHYYKFTPTQDGELLVEAGPEGVKQIRFVDKTEHRGSAQSLLKVEKFGTVAWESMKEAFKGCRNMRFAEGIDTPDLSKVTDMGFMFSYSAFNQPLNNWDVSNVTNMGRMFYYCSAFNQPLNNWDVSNVTNMERMFYFCSSFNQPLNNWNVSSVTSMGEMFAACSSFNQPLNNWNVSNVTYITGIFHGCSSFNQPLNSWDVSKMTYMPEIFYDCSAFNQDLSSWDVSNVTGMRFMFYGCSAFNQDLSSWDVSKVSDMDCMFRGCSAFNQDLSNWDVSNVTGMSLMFSNCSAFNQDLSSWDVSNVTDMWGIFYNCSAFNQNLGAWKLKACKDLGLQNCGMSIENYSKSLAGWAAQTDIKENLLLRSNNLHFNEAAKSVRTKLVKEKYWVIQGDVSEGGRVYDLIVGGVQLNSDNIASFQEALTEAGVLKKGKVSVMLEGEKPVLTLENAELTTPYDGFPTFMLEGGSNEVSIQLHGVCTITQLSSKAAIAVQNGTIAGRNTNDKLLVKGGTVAFNTAIRNCTVEIEEMLTQYTWNDGKLEIDNAVVKAKNIENVNLILKNCSILQPEGARYDEAERKVVDKDGNTAENVVIGITGGGTTVSVTGVKLAHNDLTLKIGTTFTLAASVEPANATNKAVTWSSDNDAVATVSDKGVVEAKTVGTATITATTQDGGYTATCSFTVTAEDVVLTGLTISPSEASVEVNKEVTLSVSYAPLTATHKGVKWSSSDPTIATVDEHGKVKGIAEGKVTITVVSEKYETINNTCSVTVTRPAAVEDAVFASVVVAPNPFNTLLRISNGDVRGKYTLYNTQGIEVIYGVLEGAETRINTASLAAGMYLLRLTAENGAQKTFTVVKN